MSRLHSGRGRADAKPVGAGKIKSLRQGALHSNVLDLSVAFSFGVTGHGYP